MFGSKGTIREHLDKAYGLLIGVNTELVSVRKHYGKQPFAKFDEITEALAEALKEIHKVREIENRIKETLDEAEKEL